MLFDCVPFLGLTSTITNNSKQKSPVLYRGKMAANLKCEFILRRLYVMYFLFLRFSSNLDAGTNNTRAPVPVSVLQPKTS